MKSPWVCVYLPDDEIIYDVLCLSVPKERRSLMKGLIRSAVLAANFAYWLKGFV